MDPASALSLRLLFIGLVVFVPMIVEARRAARHERRQFARGGVEPAGDVYRWMQVFYPGVFLAMLIEGVALAREPTAIFFGLGLALFVAGKGLKWWAIVTLGPFWTFRIIVVPGTVSVSGGPYRYLTHPNYVGVVGELVGAAMMTAAIYAGPAGVLVFVALMRRRVAVESRARDAILRRS